MQEAQDELDMLLEKQANITKTDDHLKFSSSLKVNTMSTSTSHLCSRKSKGSSCDPISDPEHAVTTMLDTRQHRGGVCTAASDDMMAPCARSLLRFDVRQLGENESTTHMAHCGAQSEGTPRTNTKPITSISYDQHFISGTYQRPDVEKDSLSTLMTGPPAPSGVPSDQLGPNQGLPVPFMPVPSGGPPGPKRARESFHLVQLGDSKDALPQVQNSLRQGSVLILQLIPCNLCCLLL